MLANHYAIHFIAQVYYRKSFLHFAMTNKEQKSALSSPLAFIS